MRTLLSLFFVLSLGLSSAHATSLQTTPPDGDDEEYETPDPNTDPQVEEPVVEAPNPDNPEETPNDPIIQMKADEKKQQKKKGVTILPKGSEPAESDGPTNDFTVLGTGPIRKDITPLRVAVGYPELEAVYHVPLTEDVEIGFGGGLFYGLNASTAGDLFGPKAILEAKWRFWRDAAHSLALNAAPSLYLQVHPDAAFGIIVGGPGLLYEYTIENKHHAILGVSIPWGVFFDDSGTSARIPLVFKMGLEFALQESLHLFFTTETGADIWTADSAEAYFFVRTLAGIALPL